MNRAQRRAQLKKLPAKSTAAMKSVAAQNRLVMIGNTDRQTQRRITDRQQHQAEYHAGCNHHCTR